MAPVKTYSAPDLEGPFLKWLLKHLRLQQKEGKGLDLHLHADNLGEKVSLHQVNQILCTLMFSTIRNLYLAP